jgi:hypothetical protein
MTEPIKLPPVPDAAYGTDDQYIAVKDYARLAVEQATADLRAANEALGKRQEWWNESLFRVQQALDKALAERNEARAELARLVMQDPMERVAQAHRFLNWNRAQRDGAPVRIGAEYAVYEAAAAIATGVESAIDLASLPPVKEADK